MTGIMPMTRENSSEGADFTRSTFPYVVRGLQRFGGLPPGAREYTVLDIADLLQGGLPWKVALSMRRSELISEDVLTNFLSVSGRTLHRFKKAPRRKMSRDASENAARLATVFEAAIDLFEGDEQKARKWLSSRQRGLGYRVPLELATTDLGANEVIKLIGRISWGVFG